jgi:hypothetical protein
MKNLPDRICCYLITSISYYRRVVVVSTWVLVTRTRAFRRLSAAGLARVAAAWCGRKSKAVPDEKPELATEGYRLAKIGHECVCGASAVAHPPILGKHSAAANPGF